jgi:NAD(P)-dependent dehydrogenase (short-subunit alcohol dehydrogenase family)
MRTVLVTGGGRGIGCAIARAFGQPDATVFVAGRTTAELRSTAYEIEQAGGRARALRMDVTDPDSIERAFSEMHETADSLDVVVNNAGLGGGEPVADSNIGRWRAILDTNIFGTYLVSRQAVPLMRDGGRIINISSVLGRFGVAGYTAYCASKHAVIGFTRALALELAPAQITVNAICPGWVDTDMAAAGMAMGAQAMNISYEEFRARALGAVPIERIIQPEEVAGLVMFLASAGASAITGQTYNICGGQTMD